MKLKVGDVVTAGVETIIGTRFVVVAVGAEAPESFWPLRLDGWVWLHSLDGVSTERLYAAAVYRGPTPTWVIYNTDRSVKAAAKLTVTGSDLTALALCAWEA